MKELHEELLNYLLQKHEADNSFRFLLRTINKAGRLERGYWFYGTDNSLSLSFWNAFDTNSFYPNIRLDISNEKTCKLVLEARGKEENAKEKKSLLTNIAKGLNISQQEGKRGAMKGEIIDFWVKEYPANQPYIKIIEDFLQQEKPIIDALLRVTDKTEAIPFFSQAKFSTDLSKIEKWRSALNESITFESLDDLLQKTLRPIHLYLKNITRFGEIEIDLNKQVICLIGGNGSGKSSILRGIALGLTGISPFKKDEQIPKSLQSLLRITEAVSSKLTYEGEGQITALYTLDDYTIENPCVNPIILRKSDLTAGVVGDDDLENSEESFLLNSIENRLKYLLLGFPQQSKSDSINNIEEEVGGGLPHINDIKDLILDQANDRFGIFHKWLVEMISPLKKTSPQAIEENKKLISQILEVISSIVDDNLELVDAYEETNIKTKFHPNGIPLTLVSQGYRNVIAWVGFLMKRLYEYGQRVLPEVDFRQLPAVCLIDEIDTYLHPDWQHLILKGLVEKFPNVRFIITSHSPYILASVLKEKMIIYKIETENDNPKIITENLFGADVNRATKAMDTSVRLRFYEESIEKVYRLIENNQLDLAKAEFSKNLTEIDKTEDDNIDRILRMIKNREKLNKSLETAQ